MVYSEWSEKAEIGEVSFQDLAAHTPTCKIMLH